MQDIIPYHTIPYYCTSPCHTIPYHIIAHLHCVSPLHISISCHCTSPLHSISYHIIPYHSMPYPSMLLHPSIQPPYLPIHLSIHHPLTHSPTHSPTAHLQKFPFLDHYCPGSPGLYVRYFIHITSHHLGRYLYLFCHLPCLLCFLTHSVSLALKFKKERGMVFVWSMKSIYMMDRWMDGLYEMLAQWHTNAHS